MEEIEASGTRFFYHCVKEIRLSHPLEGSCWLRVGFVGTLLVENRYMWRQQWYGPLLQQVPNLKKKKKERSLICQVLQISQSKS